MAISTEDLDTQLPKGGPCRPTGSPTRRSSSWSVSGSSGGRGPTWVPRARLQVRRLRHVRGRRRASRRRARQGQRPARLRQHLPASASPGRDGSGNRSTLQCTVPRVDLQARWLFQRRPTVEGAAGLRRVGPLPEASARRHVGDMLFVNVDLGRIGLLDAMGRCRPHGSRASRSTRPPSKRGETLDLQRELEDRLREQRRVLPLPDVPHRLVQGSACWGPSTTTTVRSARSTSRPTWTSTRASRTTTPTTSGPPTSA